MVQKLRTSRRSSLIYLVIAVALTSTIITVWRFFECDDFGDYKPAPFGYLILPENTSSPHRPNALPENDFNKLIDLDNFEFLMNHSCDGSGPLLLILVHSHPSNEKLRKTIRATWGSVIGRHFKLLFLFGIPKTKKEQRILTAENGRYGDVVQGNFADTYRNLTYKHVMALKWAIYFCPDAKYVLKCDDDVFINTPGLINYIYDRLSPYGARKLILCQVFPKNPVLRTSRSKWKVSYADFEHKYYPPYCAGYFIIYSPDVVFDLYEQAQSSRYFWIDDVHITGTMARKANVKHLPFEEFVLSKEIDISTLLKNMPNSNYSFLVGPWNLGPEQIRDLWKVVTYSKNTTTIPITKNPKR